MPLSDENYEQILVDLVGVPDRYTNNNNTHCIVLNHISMRVFVSRCFTSKINSLYDSVCVSCFIISSFHVTKIITRSHCTFIHHFVFKLYNIFLIFYFFRCWNHDHSYYCLIMLLIMNVYLHFESLFKYGVSVWCNLLLVSIRSIATMSH